ncbi:MAG: DNA-3-methyladenine glycosylase [Prochlorotrichaceae cyanobacterium]|jgi:DNA-3-methyladenine glycosylase
MSTVLRPAWFQRSSPIVAPALLGCTLVRQFANGDRLQGQIVETEAYAPDDPACHAYRKRTERNGAMFAAGGQSYVYLIYGMYHCFNVVTDAEGVGSAVLVRAIDLQPHPLLEPLLSKAAGKSRKSPLSRLAAGPGKLCKALRIDRTLNDRPLTPESGLWLESRSSEVDEAIESGEAGVVQTTRIGLSQGQEYPWRWYLQDSPAVSKP